MSAEVRHFAPNTTLLLCPFCGRTIVTYETGMWMSVYAYKEHEEMVAAHLRDHHPIRWRLNRDMRRAMRHRVPMHVTGSGPL